MVPTRDRGVKGAVLEEKAVAGNLNMLFASIISKGGQRGSYMRPKVSPRLHQVTVSKRNYTWNRGDSLKYEIPSNGSV